MRIRSYIGIATIILIIVLEFFGVLNLNVSYKYEVDHMETFLQLNEANQDYDLESRKNQLTKQIQFSYIRLALEFVVLIWLVIRKKLS